MRYSKAYRAFPLPPPDERLYDACDIIVIIPTVDTALSFSDSLLGRLKSRPSEIIVIMRDREEARVRIIAHSQILQAARQGTDLFVLTVPIANKRDQLVRGMNASKRKILALVDDDAFWDHEDVLYHLLAPFQQEDIGLVAGVVTSHLPRHQKHPDVINPWEVAAVRLRGK